MSREIKFRAWVGSERRMERDMFYISQWDGSCHYTQPYHYEHEDDVKFYDCGEEEPTIMQFTGLKDKSGKEIYEGDIVKFVGGTCDYLPCGVYTNDKYEIGTNLVVQYLSSGFTLREPISLDNDIPNLVGNVTQYDFWNHQRSLEIIGNIYENPELLNP